MEIALSKIKQVIKVTGATEINIDPKAGVIFAENFYGKDRNIVAKIEIEKADSPQLKISKKVIDLFKGNSIEFDGYTIRDSKREITINKDRMEEVEEFKPCEYRKILEIPHDKLKSGMEVISAAAKDNYRPALQGLYIKNSEIVTCDGYSLSLRKLEIDPEVEVLMPLQLAKNFIKEKSTNGNIKIYESDKLLKVVIEENSLEIITNKIEAKFINYKAIIPSEFERTIKVDAKSLLYIAKEYSNAGIDVIRISLDNDYLVTDAICLGFRIRDEIKIEYFDEKFEIAFDPKKLYKALKNYKGEVELNFNGSIQPLIIKQSDKLDMVLPIRLSKEGEN